MSNTLQHCHRCDVVFNIDDLWFDVLRSKWLCELCNSICAGGGGSPALPVEESPSPAPTVEEPLNKEPIEESFYCGNVCENRRSRESVPSVWVRITAAAVPKNSFH